jgi:hypothetical protein
MLHGRKAVEAFPCNDPLWPELLATHEPMITVWVLSRSAENRTTLLSGRPNGVVRIPGETGVGIG